MILRLFYHTRGLKCRRLRKFNLQEGSSPAYVPLSQPSPAVVFAAIRRLPCVNRSSGTGCEMIRRPARCGALCPAHTDKKPHEKSCVTKESPLPKQGDSFIHRLARLASVLALSSYFGTTNANHNDADDALCEDKIRSRNQITRVETALKAETASMLRYRSIYVFSTKGRRVNPAASAARAEPRAGAAWW